FFLVFFFFQAEDGIRDFHVTGVQTCALPIFATPANEQPELDVDLACWLDDPQIVTGTDLVGDGACISGIGLVLAPDGALAGAVDREAGGVEQRAARRREHRFGKTGDAADDVEADAYRAVQRGEFVDERGDSRGIIVERVIDEYRSRFVDGGNPMHLLGDVDAGADLRHDLLLWLVEPRHPVYAVSALCSDRSQSLISGRDELAVLADLPPEPS